MLGFRTTVHLFLLTQLFCTWLFLTSLWRPTITPNTFKNSPPVTIMLPCPPEKLEDNLTLLLQQQLSSTRLYLKAPSYFPQKMLPIQVGVFPDWPHPTFQLPLILLYYGVTLVHIKETDLVFENLYRENNITQFLSMEMGRDTTKKFKDVAKAASSDVLLYWEDTTWPRNITLRRLQMEVLHKYINHTINIKALDISKVLFSFSSMILLSILPSVQSAVQDAFGEIFKYHLKIDPRNYTGTCYVKPNMNAVKKVRK